MLERCKEYVLSRKETWIPLKDLQLEIIFLHDHVKLYKCISFYIYITLYDLVKSYYYYFLHLHVFFTLHVFFLKINVISHLHLHEHRWILDTYTN
jgi:hypothetical protein